MKGIVEEKRERSLKNKKVERAKSAKIGEIVFISEDYFCNSDCGCDEMCQCCDDVCSCDTD